MWKLQLLQELLQPFYKIGRFKSKNATIWNFLYGFSIHPFKVNITLTPALMMRNSQSVCVCVWVY